MGLRTGATAREQQRSGHVANTLTHHADNQTSGPVDYGIQQTVSASQHPGGHCVVQEPVPRQHLCESTTQNIPAQPYREKQSQKQDFPILKSLLLGPTDCNDIMDLYTGLSSSVTEETNLNRHLPAVAHCEGQQGSTSSQPPVLNYGELTTNVLPQTSTENIHCTVMNTVAALLRQGSNSVSPETPHGHSPSLRSLPEPSTDKNSALEKNKVLTKNQMLDFIAQRLKVYKIRAQNRNNREYGRPNSEEEQTLRSSEYWIDRSEEDPSHCLANQFNSRTGTLKVIGDASSLNAVVPAVKSQGSSDTEKMEREGLSGPGAKQSFTTDKEGYEEDCTKEDSANTLLTQKVKESDNCAKSTPGKCWKLSTPITAEENSSHTHEIKSADQKASLGFDSPVKNLSDVTVSLDSDGQVIDSNNCCKDKTCNVSEDESYNIEHCKKTSRNVLPTVPILLYTSVALKELVASLENSAAPVVPRDNVCGLIIQHYWDGDIKKLGFFSSVEYRQIMMDVSATCTKDEDGSPVVLTAISGNCPTFTVKHTPSQEEYKSFWLNINEGVDDIDKEPGVAWFTRDKGEEDISLKAADTADMVDSIPNETDIVFPAKQLQETVAEESPTDRLFPLKISVLSVEEARRIFDLHQSESNPKTMLEHGAPLSENDCKGHASPPGNQNEQQTEVGPSQDEDVTQNPQTKSHLVLSVNKVQELSSLCEHQDVKPSKQTDINYPKYDNDESPQYGDLKEDPKGQLSAPLNGNQTDKVASLSGNQREGQSNQINANDANPVYSQPELRTRLPENGCQQQASLSGLKDEKPVFPSICKDSKYEDITDDDKPKYEDISDEGSPKYEDITDEDDSQTDVNMNQQNESITSLSENNSQKQAPPCRNKDNGQKQAITEITSKNQALCRTEKDALKQTCCCPYLVETEDGFENRLCPTCETEKELGMKTKDLTSYVSSSVLKGLDDELVLVPVSGIFCPLSDDGDREEVPKEPFSQTDAKELDYKGVTEAKTCVTKTEAALQEQLSEHGDPQCEQFLDLEHEELMVDESPQNEETSVTGDKDFQYRDETEEEEEDEDDWIVIHVALSDLIFEPTDGDHVSPKNALPQDVEIGEKQEDDISCRVINMPHCEVQYSTSKPATASPSSNIEEFESLDRFLKVKNLNFVHCPIFPAPEDIQTRDQSPMPQILSVETESEPEYDGELHTPQKKSQASTSETEHSSDYSISSPQHNYLTASKKSWKNCQIPKSFRVSANSDSEDDMLNVSQRIPLPESDSESEDDECTDNVGKCQKRRLPTTTEREDSSDKSGCMITNRQSTESKTGNIQCRSKRPKLSNDKHMATAEIERYSQKTDRQKRKLTCTASEDDSVTSQKRHATELADNQCTDEGVSSPQQARVSKRKRQKSKTSEHEAKATSSKQLSTSRECPSTSRKLTCTASEDDSVTSQKRHATELADNQCTDEGVPSPQQARVSKRKRQKSKTSEHEAKATSSKQLSTSRECPSTSRECPSTSEEVLSNSRQGLLPSRECISNATEGSPSIECLSISKQGSSSREHLSKSREGPSTSRKGSEVKSRKDLSSKDSLSKSSKGSSSKEFLSKSNEGSSSSMKARPSSSLEGPSVSRHASSKSTPCRMTKARQLVHNQWEPTYHPTRRDRRTGCGTDVEDLKTSPTHSKYNPEKVQRDAEREARLRPKHYDRGPRQRHSSRKSATPLVKKSMDQWKQYTKATHRETPHERRHSVGEGYKWKDRRHSCETKGSSRERMERGSLPDPYY